MIEEFPISWLECELQPMETRALQKWSGLASSSNTSILFFPANRGSLALPSLVTLYKKMKATRMVQLFTSRDPSVRKAAELHLEEERKSLRAKYRPAEFVDDLLSCDQFHKSAHCDERLQFLCQLTAQGGMARSWEETSPELWVKAVHSLPPEPLKFALNASLGTLPTNANLHTVGQEDQRHLQPVQGTSAISHPYP